MPKVEVQGSAPGDTVKGKLELKPTAIVPGGGKIDHFELFVDELRHSECKPDGVLTFDTTQVADGWHELRVVAIEASLIRSQGRVILPVQVSNRDKKLVVKVAPEGKMTADTTITVTAAAAGATGIVVLHNGQLLGRINGASGECSFSAGKMGRGPVTLRIIALGAVPSDYVFGKPVELTVN